MFDFWIAQRREYTIMTKSELPFGVNRADVLRYLGYRPGKTMHWEAIEGLLERSEGKASQLVEPVGLSRSVACDSPEIVELQESAEVRRMLKDAVIVVLLAVTLGPRITEEVDRLFHAGHYAEAAILDAIGSAAAEQAMNCLHRITAQKAQPSGLAMTERLSPGYGVFPLTWQSALCDLLQTSQIGVSVNDHSLLLPRKSITAVAGLRKGTIEDKIEQPCKSCGNHACAYRIT
jgi:hypothetical protein